MSKHAANTTSTTKKFLAAAGLAFGVASLGLFGSAGTAAADGHNIPDPEPMGANWGDPDGAEVRDVSMVPAVDSYVTSSYPAGSGTPNVWPKPLANLPSASYPADPSHPGSGWGVDDRA
jgi:hypothetical protein